MSRRARSPSAWRPVVRGVAAAALAAAVRRAARPQEAEDPRGRDHRRAGRRARRRSPSSAAERGPATPPCTRCRCGAFLNAQGHAPRRPRGAPRAPPDRLPVRADTAIGGGELPNVRAQRALSGLPKGNPLDSTLSWVHWLWFFEPHSSLVWILARHPERFPRSARQMAAVFDLGLRRLRRGSDRAALVGVRAGAHRREGAADHGRGRRGAAGAAPGSRCTRSSAATPGRRCPRCTSRRR